MGEPKETRPAMAVPMVVAAPRTPANSAASLRRRGDLHASQRSGAAGDVHALQTARTMRLYRCAWTFLAGGSLEESRTAKASPRQPDEGSFRLFGVPDSEGA